MRKKVLQNFINKIPQMLSLKDINSYINFPMKTMKTI